MSKSEVEELASTVAFWANSFMTETDERRLSGGGLNVDANYMAKWFENVILTTQAIGVTDQVPNLRFICQEIHADNVRAGWWSDLETGERKERNVGELLMLITSELAEAMEGDRKGLMDDKLPHRKMFEVELADAFIRIADTATGLGFDLAGAVAEKRAYNLIRADHKPENRKLEDGKKY